MFQVGDKIVHPMHGAGIVESIVQKKVNGVMRDYYVLKLPVRAMVVMIPTDNSEEIGVRPIVDREQADQVLAAIPGIEVDMTQNWNRRYRENLERLKSGNLLEVARVVKGLMLRELERGLSTGERKMLHSAKEILISEIVLSQRCTYEDVEARINAALNKYAGREARAKRDRMVPFFRQEGEPIGRNLETIGPEKGQRGAHLLGGDPSGRVLLPDGGDRQDPGAPGGTPGAGAHPSGVPELRSGP